MFSDVLAALAWLLFFGYAPSSFKEIFLFALLCMHFLQDVVQKVKSVSIEHMHIISSFEVLVELKNKVIS